MNCVPSIINKLTDITFIRFLLVGCLNTAFGVGMYCLFIYLGTPYFIASLFSNVLGVLWNFKTTGKLVFKNDDNRLIFRFVLCYLLIYFINIGIIKCFITIGINEYYAGILATPIVAACSFGLLKTFVYNKKEK